MLRGELLEYLGLKKSALSRKIKRGWADQIENPDYNGKNDRYLILLDSIQDGKVRESIRQRLKEAGKAQELSLEEAKESGGDALERTVLDGTVKHLATNVTYLYTHFSAEIAKNHLSYTGYYMKYRLSPARLLMYSRTAAFVACAHRMCRMLKEEIDNRDLHIYESAFVANMYALISLYKEDLQLICPSSFRRFSNWLCDKMNAAFDDAAIDDILPVKNAHNRTRSKIVQAQKDIINQWYGEGLTGTQIYEKMKVVALKNEWPSPSQSTIYRFIRASANDVSLARHGKIEFINNVVPTISRLLPDCKNEIWGVDTTAHDELVNWNGKCQKQMWVCRVYDYATMRMLGSVTSFNREDSAFITSAIATAVRNAGYAPKFLNMDHGPGYHLTVDWCKRRNIKVMASGIGKSRSKLIEQFLGQLRYYNMTLPGYVGQNRTAKSLDSKVAGKRYDRAHNSAPGYADAVRHAVVNAQEAWNNHIIKTLDKTPDELWAEKSSATEEMTPILLSAYFGHQHAIKLGISGLTVENKGEKITFFPEIDTDESRRTAIYFFKKYFQCERGSRKLIVACSDDYQVAYIFDKPPDVGGVHLMTMPRKPFVAMVAKTPEEQLLLDQFREFQKEFESTAIEAINQSKKAYESRDDIDFLENVKLAVYTGRKRFLPPESKEYLRLEDGGFVDADGVLYEESGVCEYKEVKDPDTEEIIMIRVKSDE